MAGAAGAGEAGLGQKEEAEARRELTGSEPLPVWGEATRRQRTFFRGFLTVSVVQKHLARTLRNQPVARRAVNAGHKLPPFSI